MELFLYLSGGLYALFGLWFFRKSMSTVPRLMRQGRRHPAAVIARVKGVPEWAISMCLGGAAGAAMVVAMLMASLWPVVVAIDKVVRWQ